MPSVFEYRKQHQAWQKRYDAHASKAGDPAPDFQLSDVNGENPVRLSDLYSEGPVALVFGIFT
jgi:hypothetical protein